MKCAAGALYTSFAPTGAPALAELGHPDVASGRYSWAARKPAGRRPEPNLHSGRAVCGTYPQHPPPRSRTLFPSRVARGSHPCRGSRTHYSTCPERGREAGERSVCSVATSGCPTRSEDGFPVGARNIPPRPIQPKIKTPHHSVRGSGRAADGNRTRVSGLGSVRSTIELQPHLFQCIAPACRR